MPLRVTTPVSTEPWTTTLAQIFTNDIMNQVIDDNAVFASAGYVRGNVVKWNSVGNNWSLCNGTTNLLPTDTVGIVEYVSGTAGQVRTSGVFINASLTANTLYYCQSNGTLGTTVTPVFMGRCAANGRLLIPVGGGSGLTPTQITSQNMNTVINPGSYSCTSCTNTPSGLDGYALVEASGTTGYLKQTYTNYDGSGIFYRVDIGGTWGGWQQIPQGYSAAGIAALAISASLFAASGYIKFINGLIIQWGTYTTTGNWDAVSFPIAFPNACLAVVPITRTQYDGGTLTSVAYCLDRYTPTYFVGAMFNGVNWRCTWVAIGY